MEINKIHNMDCLAGLKLMEDKSVHCVVTSPPYWGLRNYDVDGQLGLEKTPKLFIKKIVAIFKEVKRVLRDDGVIWVNMGDSYAATQKTRAAHHLKKSTLQSKGFLYKDPINKRVNGLKPKDMVGIPWLLAFALRDDGWYLRQDIIWSKPNPMPESAQDRCTKSHEYIFLLSKKQRYYYDAKAIATPYADKTYTTFGIPSKGYGDGSGMIQSENWANSIEVRKPKQWKTPDGWDTGPGTHGSIHRNGREKGRIPRPSDSRGGNQGSGDIPATNYQLGLANKRSVWTVASASFKEAHFATFPEDLIIDCIKAGCPAEGIVLDPFMGAGTTALVAQKLGRNFIGFELNPKYVEMANKRLNSHLGMFSPENIKAISPQQIQLTIE